MADASPTHLVVGHLNKAHGTKGELFVWPLTVDPESAFAPGEELRAADDTDREPDSALPALRIEAVRAFKRGYLLKLDGVDSRSAAELLAGRYVLKPFDSLTPLADDELFYHELVGMAVETMAGERIGEVAEVYELVPAHMLEVSRGPDTLLIPFTKEIVRSVDRAGRTLVVDPPEGLLDL